MLIAIASEIVVRYQPMAFCSGTINTLGVARIPAATMSTTNVAAATNQA